MNPWVLAQLLLWRATVLGVCTYLVFWMGHSGWWYLLAVVLYEIEFRTKKGEK